MNVTVFESDDNEINNVISNNSPKSIFIPITAIIFYIRFF